MKSALFFDVDGTLIDSYHEQGFIAPAVLDELLRVQGLGHKIFLSSGRSRNLLTPELLAPGFDGFVLINGGYVEVDDQPLYEERMGVGLARRTVDFLEDLGCEYLIVSAKATYTKRSNTNLVEFFSRWHDGIFTFDYDLDQVLERAIKMEAIVEPERRPEVTALAQKELGSAISCDGHGGEGTFELYPTAISKAKGIGVVVERMGIDVRHTYGFGDGVNDLEMIRSCGCGVAMGNAEKPVKDAANMVCPPVWEDGLAVALRELF